MSQTEPQNPQLHAGAAMVDITPQAGTHLAGSVGEHRPAKLVAEPTFARVLILESAGRKLCLVALDVTIVTAPYTARIREAAQRLGFESDAVMVHATQTHSAPPIGKFMVDDDFPELPPEFEWLTGGEDEYANWALQRIAEALSEADANLQPVEIAAGSGIEGRMAFNRRAVKHDGTIGMPGPRNWIEPLGPTWIRYIEGPIDPELGVVCLRGANLGMAAMLLHYTCHPVHVFPRPIVSPDWPGAWAEEMRRTHGRQCVPLVLNGCCGNINPWPPYDPDYVEDHRRMGRVLAETSAPVIESLQFSPEAELDWRVRHLQIPIREVPADDLKWAQEYLDHNPVPPWEDESAGKVARDWTRASGLVSVELCRKRQGDIDYEVQVLRLGEIAIVGLPGEPFVEGQLRIKLASPARFTYVAHCTTEYVGYIPTSEALTRGGHEGTTSYWAKLAPEALDMIVSASVKLLDDLFAS
jgi:neutral ceramidase